MQLKFVCLVMVSLFAALTGLQACDDLEGGSQGLTASRSESNLKRLKKNDSVFSLNDFVKDLFAGRVALNTDNKIQLSPYYKLISARAYDDNAYAFLIFDVCRLRTCDLQRYAVNHKEVLINLNLRALRGEDSTSLDALYVLGFYYYYAAYEPDHYKHAHSFFLKAAQLGHKQSQFSLAQMYRSGDGAGKDLELADYWTYRFHMDATEERELFLMPAEPSTQFHMEGVEEEDWCD